MKLKYEKKIPKKGILFKNDDHTINQSMLCGKNQTKNIIKEKTTAKTIETVKTPKNDKLNSNQFFNKCYVKGEENKSKNIGTRQYHTSHKLQKPEQEVIDYLHTTTKGLDKQVAQKQKDGGYQPDDWGHGYFWTNF